MSIGGACAVADALRKQLNYQDEAYVFDYLVSRMPGVYQIFESEKMLYPTENIKVVDPKKHWNDYPFTEHIGFPHHFFYDEEARLIESFDRRVGAMMETLGKQRVTLFRMVIENFDEELVYLKKLNDLFTGRGYDFETIVVLPKANETSFKQIEGGAEGMDAYVSNFQNMRLVIEHVMTGATSTPEVTDREPADAYDYGNFVQPIMRYWEK